MKKNEKRGRSNTHEQLLPERAKKNKTNLQCYLATRKHLTSAPPSPSFNRSIRGSQSYKGHPKWIFFEIHSPKLKKEKKIAFTFQHSFITGLMGVQVSKSLGQIMSL